MPLLFEKKPGGTGPPSGPLDLLHRGCLRTNGRGGGRALHRSPRLERRMRQGRVVGDPPRG